MKSIDLNRLRKFAQDANFAHAALMRAQDEMDNARKRIPDYERSLQVHFDYHGEELDPKEDAVSVNNARARLQADLKVGRHRLSHARAAYQRVSAEYALATNLARNGVEYARRRVAIPSDIEELFQ